MKSKPLTREEKINMLNTTGVPYHISLAPGVELTKEIVEETEQCLRNNLEEVLLSEIDPEQSLKELLAIG